MAATICRNFDGNETMNTASFPCQQNGSTSRTSENFSLESLLEEECFGIDVPSNNWFLLLKNKIVDTDKLIQKFKTKSRKVKELQTSLAGLKQELTLLHQENGKNISFIAKLKEQLERTKNMEENQKIYIDQLKARLEEMELKARDVETVHSSMESLKKENKELLAERDSLRRENRSMNKRLKMLYRKPPHQVFKESGVARSGVVNAGPEFDNAGSDDDLERREIRKQKEKLISELEEELNKLGTVIDGDDNSSCCSFEGFEEEDVTNDLLPQDLVSEKSNIPDPMEVVMDTADGGNNSELDEEEVNPQDPMSVVVNGGEDSDLLQTVNEGNEPSLLVMETEGKNEEELPCNGDMSTAGVDKLYSPSHSSVDSPFSQEKRRKRNISEVSSLSSASSSSKRICLEERVDEAQEITNDEDDVSNDSSADDDDICCEMLNSLERNYRMQELENTLSPLPPSRSPSPFPSLSSSPHLASQPSHLTSPPSSPSLSLLLSTFDYFPLSPISPLPPSPPTKQHSSEEDGLHNRSLLIPATIDIDSSHSSLPMAVPYHPRPSTNESQQITEEVFTGNSPASNDNSIDADYAELVIDDPLETTSLNRNDVTSKELPLLPDNVVVGSTAGDNATNEVLVIATDDQYKPSLEEGDVMDPSVSDSLPFEDELVEEVENITASTINCFSQVTSVANTIPSTYAELGKNASAAINEEIEEGEVVDDRSEEDNTDCSLKGSKREALTDSLATPEDSEQLSVGYSNPVIYEQVKPDKKKPTKKTSLTDGATGQWMKEMTPDNFSRSSSRSSSPLLGNMSQDFPVVGGTAQTTSKTPPIQSVCPPEPQPPSATKFCQAQQLLNEQLQCPMPLPPWLAEALLQSQDSPLALKNEKGKNKIKIPNMTKPKGMKVTEYLFKAIHATINGRLTVSKCLQMLSNSANFSNPSSLGPAIIRIIKTRYFPDFESVMKLCWGKCSAVVSKTVDPLNPNYVPPLPLQEAIMVSLLLNVQQMRKDFAMLLHDTLQKLRECILSTDVNFHARCISCRMYCSLCRVFSDIDQAQFLVCDLLLQSVAISSLPLIVAVVSIWPKAFSRNTSGPPLFVKKSINTKGLEYQPISFTLEAVMSILAQTYKDQTTTHKGPLSNARILCKWEMIAPQTVQSMIGSFIEILQFSPYVKIETPPYVPGSPHPQPRPRPSKHAYAIVMALRVLAVSQGWAWTNDTLIVQHLWPLLKKWNKQPSSVRSETIVCIMRLLGFVGQIGNDPNSPSIRQLIKVFIVVIQKSSSADTKVSVPVQLAATDALLNLCPPTSAHNMAVKSTITTWTRQLLKNKETTNFAIEYSNIISTR